MIQKIKMLFIFVVMAGYSLAQQTRFEKSNGTETATYPEIINWYQQLDELSSIVHVKTMGMTDAGFPLHLVMVDNSKQFDPVTWHKEKRVIIFINNGIHPGEPDGIDASMMLLRDIAANKVILPDNVVLAVIPVYNIGGCLNRNSTTRVNQNGPKEYGFRGNSQNLDLNRDFTKCDSKEARSFIQIFQYLQPEIFIDNHVSDGADYRHTMTLITTQYDKLGFEQGKYLRDNLEPALYKSMKGKGWEMIPYLNFEGLDYNKPMAMFLETPRYSSGYTSLFQTFGFIPETHMLKPYAERVKSTYDLMETFIETASSKSNEIISVVQSSRNAVRMQQAFPLSWTVDTTHNLIVNFKAYERDTAMSEATGLEKMFYNHAKPLDVQLSLYDHYTGTNEIKKPLAYIIPQGWSNIIELLKINGVAVNQLKKDSQMAVTQYHIDQYKSMSQPYEKHHKNYAVKASPVQKNVVFRKGDYIIYLNQHSNRFLVEMLEPTGDDSYFAWNYFDGILQQKEWYSDYRWEDIAAEMLKKDTVLQQELNTKKAADPKFAGDSEAILKFIYLHSPYYESAHLNYPVYRVEMK